MQSRSADPAGANQHRLDEGIHFWAKLAAIPSSVEQRPLFALLSESLVRLQQDLHFDHYAFSFFDPAREVIAIIFESGQFRFPREVPVNHNSLGLVIELQQAIEVNDTQTDTRFPDLNLLAEDAGFHSFRLVPWNNGSSPTKAQLVF